MSTISSLLVAPPPPPRSAATAAAGSADFSSMVNAGPIRSGRLGMTVTPQGTPSTIVYFAADGTELNRTPMIPSRMLELMERYGIDKSELNGLADQLDSQGVSYKPGEMVHGVMGVGVDLKNLAAGGFGTAFDWTQDPLVSLKGPGAASQLAADKSLAARLGVHYVSPEILQAASTASISATITSSTPSTAALLVSGTAISAASNSSTGLSAKTSTQVASSTSATSMASTTATGTARIRRSGHAGAYGAAQMRAELAELRSLLAKQTSATG